MFHSDDSPIRVIASPQFSDLLEAAQAENPQLAVMLDDHSAKLVAQAPADEAVIFLGELPDSRTPCYASSDSHTQWWRYQARLGLQSEEIGYQLTPLDDSQLAAAVATGPLPRGPRANSES